MVAGGIAMKHLLQRKNQTISREDGNQSGEGGRIQVRLEGRGSRLARTKCVGLVKSRTSGRKDPP